MKPFKVIYRPFPAECGTVTGAISQRNNRVLILIDSNRDEQTQRRTLRHELGHLMLGHLDNDVDPVDVLEREADAYADRLTDDELSALLAGGIV